MKLLHTSDLHLGATWRGRSRRDDQARVLDEVLALCEEHNVDAVVVAGDVFSDRVEGSVAQVARHFLERLRDHLKRGRVVFVLRGNHDPLGLFQLMRLLAMDLAGHDRWPIVVADRPGVYTLPGLRHQVIALPYLSPSMLRTEAMDVGLSLDEQLPALSGQLAALLERLYRRATPDAPAIFAAHVQVEGIRLTEEITFEAGYNRDLWLAPSSLPQFTSYNALGHIHLGQEVTGTGKPTWYSGAPDRLDLGEREYQPRVLIVSAPDTPGGVATVTPVQLTTCTPFVRAELWGLPAVEDFCATLGTSDPLGELVISEVEPSRRGVAEADIKRVAPRLDVRWAVDERALVGAIGDDDDPRDVSATVTRFLERTFAEQPERKARLLVAFRTLLNEADEVIA